MMDKKTLRENVQWLFFDVGSTLVSEDKPFLHRLHEIAEAVNEPFEVIEDKVLKIYKEKKKAEHVLIKEYGIERPQWHTEEEELYFQLWNKSTGKNRSWRLLVLRKME